MGIRNFPVISIGENRGARSVVAAAGQINLSAITTSGGSTPKYVYCAVSGGTAGNIIVISPEYTGGSIGGAEIDNAWPLSLDDADWIILNVHGFFRISFNTYVGDGTSFLHCIPLEDF